MDIGNMKHMNSIEDIEEDIKILEEFKTNGYNILLMKYGDRIKTNFKLAKAIEHILSDYKRVLKENEYLKEKWDKDTHILRNELDLINANRLDLLQQNKELRKENEEVKENCKKCIIRDELDEYVNNSIPIKKVKDKIEELKKKVEELTDDKGYWGGSDLLEQIKVLQVLLEKEK